jgi:hypothetical protein
VTGPGLARRLRAIEQRARSRQCDRCEHPAAGFPPGRDWRGVFKASLRAFSPDAEDRAAYQAEQEALAATPPCPRCGWCPDVVYITTTGHWEQGDDHVFA